MPAISKAAFDLLHRRRALRWAVTQCSAQQLLNATPRGFVDHVITDPPYSARTHRGARTNKRGVTGTPITFAPLADLDFVDDLLRVAKRWVLCCTEFEMLGDFRRRWGAEYVRGMPWIKPDGMPQRTGDRPGQAGEAIATLHNRGRKRWNRGGSLGYYIVGVERQERMVETQKPMELCVKLVLDFTDPGDLILDPWCGSGSFGVAALRTGRRYLGCDRDPAAVRKARRRLSAAQHMLTVAEYETAQLPLLAAT